MKENIRDEISSYIGNMVYFEQKEMNEWMNQN